MSGERISQNDRSVVEATFINANEKCRYQSEIVFDDRDLLVNMHIQPVTF